MVTSFIKSKNDLINPNLNPIQTLNNPNSKKPEPEKSKLALTHPLTIPSNYPTSLFTSKYS